jgi:hypothetical protein
MREPRGCFVLQLYCLGSLLLASARVGGEVTGCVMRMSVYSAHLWIVQCVHQSVVREVYCELESELQSRIVYTIQYTVYIYTYIIADR